MGITAVGVLVVYVVCDWNEFRGISVSKVARCWSGGASGDAVPAVRLGVIALREQLREGAPDRAETRA